MKERVANGETFETGDYRAKESPTMGYRGYVPFEEKLLYDLPNYNPEAQQESLMDYLKQINAKNVDGGLLGDDGTYKDKSSWATTTNLPGYSYGSYGGSGSYGSSYYNPKIYSTSRSINTSRPATMYAKTPYTAKTTYLNPNFSTKGSREAYKRSDI